MKQSIDERINNTMFWLKRLEYGWLTEQMRLDALEKRAGDDPCGKTDRRSVGKQQVRVGWDGRSGKDRRVDGDRRGIGDTTGRRKRRDRRR